MCVASKTLASRAISQHRRASSLDSSLASWRQGEASTLGMSEIALDTSMSSTGNAEGRPHRSSTVTLFGTRRLSQVHDNSMPGVPGQPSDVCKGSDLVAEEIVATLANLSQKDKLQVLATAQALAAATPTAPVAVSPPTVAVGEAVEVVAAPALPLQVEEEEVVAEHEQAMVPEGPPHVTVSLDLKTLRFGVKHLGPCEDDLDICKSELRREVFEISVGGGHARWFLARSEMEVRDLRTAFRGHEAPDFLNAFSHTPIEAYKWTGKPHDEMTVPFLGYLINDRQLWKDYRARLYIATFFELPNALAQFPELHKIFYKMPSREMEKLAFYESQRAKIRAEVRHKQAKREAAAAAAAAPRYEVKCSGRPFVTSEVTHDIFGCKYYKDFTVYPFKVSYNGATHDFHVRHSAMAPLYKLTQEAGKKEHEADKQNRREANIKEQWYSGEKPVVYTNKEENNYDPAFDLKVQSLRCKFDCVKAAVNRFNKTLVADRYNTMYHTFQRVLKMKDWHTIEAVRQVMDFDGFARKVRLSMAQKANGEAMQGVMGA